MTVRDSKRRTAITEAGDKVVFEIRVYNEGEVDATGIEIHFFAGELPDNSVRPGLFHRRFRSGAAQTVRQQEDAQRFLVIHVFSPADCYAPLRITRFISAIELA